MAIAQTRGERVFAVFNTALLAGFCFIAAYPVLFVFFASISEPERLISHSGVLLRPLGFTLEGYARVLANPNVLTGFSNTFFYVIVGTALRTFFTILGAYVLSRRRLMWGRFITLLIVFTMFFDGGLIPRYFVVRGLGMLNSRAAIIVPRLIWTYNMIIIRTFFTTLPESLEESAKMDGASHWTVLWRIIVPLSMPAIAVIILFYGVALWNGWFEALIYLRDRALWPLQLFLREILVANQAEEMMEGVQTIAARRNLSEIIKYAIIVVSVVPIAMVYPFLQKFFVKGIMIGALKG